MAISSKNFRQKLVVAPGDKQSLTRALRETGLSDAAVAELHDAIAGRLPDAVEAAAYYLVAEALTNATKHADAHRVQVDVHREGAEAVVEVADDGAGVADEQTGSGLRGLHDRIEALGGALDLHSPRGDGTTLRARIPCR